MDLLRGFFGANKRSSAPAFQTVFEQLNAETHDDLERRRNHIAASFEFNLAITVLVVVNAVITGIEVDMYRGEGLDDRLGFFVCDFVFFLVFFVEMLVRMNQLGWDYFVDPWNVFDYTIVVLNCSDLVISANNQGSAGLKLASTLRCLRLLRVVRVIRGVKLFHSLWLILQGILDSLRTLIWVGILLVIITYCIAVTVTTLLLDDAQSREQWRYVEQYLGDPWRSMWTVFQVITLDRWAVDVVRPLVKVSPLAAILMIMAIVICTFGVTNLIIAVMVERVQTIMHESTNISNQVLERTEFDVLKSMGEDFQMAQLDANGELSLEEFRRVLRSPSIVLKLRLLGVQCDEAEQLFELMDADHSGAVSPEEFVYGLQKLRGEARGQDLVALICSTQKQCSRAAKYVERMKHLNAKADLIQERLNRIGTGMTGELVGRRHAAQRNEEVWKSAAERQGLISQLDRNRQVEFPALTETSARYGILY